MIERIKLLLFLLDTALALESYDNPYVVDLHRLKCESLPHISGAIENNCYALLPEKKGGDDYISTFKQLPSSDVTFALRNIHMLGQNEYLELERGEYMLFSRDTPLQLLAFEMPVHCPPDAKPFGNRCYLFDERRSSREEAQEHCAYRGMRLLQPHSDKDIRAAIEVTKPHEVNDILLAGTWSGRVGWESNDEFKMDFFRWHVPESDIWNYGEKFLNTKLHLQNDKSGVASALSHISVEKTSSLLPFVCVSEVEPEEVVVQTTTIRTFPPTTTTRKTTRKTTTPTTTTRRVCYEWTQWNPKCSYHKCGSCVQQTRTRRLMPGCPGTESYQMRNCYYGVCFFPEMACEEPCRAIVAQGRHCCAPPSYPSPWDCMTVGCSHRT